MDDGSSSAPRPGSTRQVSATRAKKGNTARAWPTSPRVHSFLSMLFRDRAGKRVLVVSHGGTLRVFRYLLERWTHDEFVERFESDPVPNCAVTTYVFDAAARRLVLRELNRVHWLETPPTV